MPSWEIFEHQPREYRDAVLPPAVRAHHRPPRAGRAVSIASSSVLLLADTENFEAIDVNLVQAIGKVGDKS